MNMRIGRITLATTLIGVGLVLVVDNLTGSSLFTYLVRLWPVLLIGLGIEWIVGAGRAQGAGNPVRVDSGALVLLIIFALIAAGLANRPLQGNRTVHIGGPLPTIVPVPGGETTGQTVVLMETPDIPDLQAMLVTGNWGDVTVIGGDSLRVEARVRAWGHTPADADNLAHQARLVIERGAHTQVRVDGPAGARMEVQFIVTVPHTGLSVAVTTTSGSIQVNGTDGPVSAQTSSGNISVEAGQVHGDYDLVAASGNISLTLPPDASAKVAARTSSGRVSGPPWLIIGEGRGSGSATLGDGTYQVSLQTSSGNIDIGVR